VPDTRSAQPRFRDAVPVRRDRRDLRRRFRRVTHVVTGEQRAEMTAVLRRLSADHVPLEDVIPAARGTGTIAVFAGGTRIRLGIRCGGGEMERLGQDDCAPPALLACVRSCFGRRWLWLWFTSADGALLAEVLAIVSPAASGCPG
jgi:hypothetical protein